MQRSGHKVQRSGPTSTQVSRGCSSNIQLQPPPPPTRTNTAQCSNHCNLHKAHEFLTNPYASCSDCCIVLCWSWSVVVVVVVVVECCCCIPYQLALMLVLTFAPSVLTFAPCTLIFVPCTIGAILLSFSASTPVAHMVVVTDCNLCWWHFSFRHGASTPCTGSGANCCNLRSWTFPSTHWHTYSTYTQATCTRW